MLIIFGLLTAGVWALLFSTPGLRVLTNLLIPEDTRIEGVSGSLVGPGKVFGIEWSSEKLDVEIDHIAWGASPFSYSNLGVQIDTDCLPHTVTQAAGFLQTNRNYDRTN